MGWLPNFTGPRLVGGDFNSWGARVDHDDDEPESSDTWQDVTGSNQNGYTVNNAVRFDSSSAVHRRFPGDADQLFRAGHRSGRTTTRSSPTSPCSNHPLRRGPFIKSCNKQSRRPLLAQRGPFIRCVRGRME